jgi:hypothetical protein
MNDQTLCVLAQMRQYDDQTAGAGPPHVWYPEEESHCPEFGGKFMATWGIDPGNDANRATRRSLPVVPEILEDLLFACDISGAQPGKFRWFRARSATAPYGLI